MPSETVGATAENGVHDFAREEPPEIQANLLSDHGIKFEHGPQKRAINKQGLSRISAKPLFIVLKQILLATVP